jgi:hypothetical protein
MPGERTDQDQRDQELIAKIKAAKAEVKAYQKQQRDMGRRLTRVQAQQELAMRKEQQADYENVLSRLVDAKPRVSADASILGNPIPAPSVMSLPRPPSAPAIAHHPKENTSSINLGTGIGVLQPGQQVVGKSLKAGPATVITENSEKTEITITTTATPGEGVYVESLGAAEPILIDSGGVLVDTVQGKSIKAGTNITFDTATEGEIKISSTGDAIHVNTGDGDGLIFTDDPPEGYVEARTITDTATVDVRTSGNVITLDVIATSAGAGQDVYAGVNPDNGLYFRSLTGSAGIVVTTPNEDEVNIAGQGTLVNTGSGFQVLIDPQADPDYAEFRTLVDGDGIGIVQGTTTLTISFAYLQRGDGIGVTSPVELGSAVFKSISNDGKHGIAVDTAEEDDTIRIQVKAANIGGEKEVLKGIDDDEGVQFRTLKAGTGITLTENSEDITIDGDLAIADDDPEMLVPVSISGGEPVWKRVRFPNAWITGSHTPFSFRHVCPDNKIVTVADTSDDDT